VAVTGAIMIELTRREQHTVAFLRMTAVEARRLAECAPEIAVQLRHIARQLDIEAADLESPSPDIGFVG
jgi:hypothetical protein